MLRQGTIRILMKAGFSSDLTPSLDIMGGGGHPKRYKVTPLVRGECSREQRGMHYRRGVEEMEGRRVRGGRVTQRRA